MFFAMSLLFLGSVGFSEILVVLLIVLLLFGAKKIPELMKSFGKGVRSFKDGMNGTGDGDGKDGNAGGKDSVSGGTGEGEERK